MNHTELIRTIPRDQRQSLTSKSNLHGIIRLNIHLGAICLFAWLIITVDQFQLPLLIIQGILIIFLFAPLHEAIHRIAFKSIWINRLVANICGFLIFIPVEWFRYFHLSHHKYTQNPDKDPELLAEKPTNLGMYIFHISGFPLWWSLIKTLLKNAFGISKEPFIPLSGSWALRKESICFLIGYILILVGILFYNWDVLIYIWLIPILLGQPFLRMFLLAEHGRCPVIMNMLENSRTTFTNMFIRFLSWNMSYHAEHHSYPAVPFFKLPELFKITENHLITTEKGYLKFHKDYIYSLKII